MGWGSLALKWEQSGWACTVLYPNYWKNNLISSAQRGKGNPGLRTWMNWLGCREPKGSQHQALQCGTDASCHWDTLEGSTNICIAFLSMLYLPFGTEKKCNGRATPSRRWLEIFSLLCYCLCICLMSSSFHLKNTVHDISWEWETLAGVG